VAIPTPRVEVYLTQEFENQDATLESLVIATSLSSARFTINQLNQFIQGEDALNLVGFALIDYVTLSNSWWTPKGALKINVLT
jgi:hypothetical protein